MPAAAVGPPPRSGLGRVGAGGSRGARRPGGCHPGRGGGLRCSGPGRNLLPAPEPRPGDPRGGVAAPRAGPCLPQNSSGFRCAVGFLPFLQKQSPPQADVSCGSRGNARSRAGGRAKERRVARSIPRRRCRGFSAGRVPSPCEGWERPSQGRPQAGGSAARRQVGAEWKGSAAVGITVRTRRGPAPSPGHGGASNSPGQPPLRAASSVFQSGEAAPRTADTPTLTALTRPC